MAGTYPRRVIIRLVFAVGIALTFAAPVLAQNLEKVRLSIADLSFTFLPHLLARDAGIFRKHHLEVELIYIGGAVGLAALASGEIDYSASPDPGLLAIAKGLPFKVVMLTTKGPPFYVVGRPSIKRAAELVGKKHGISRVGASSYFVSWVIFQKLGVDADKIIYIQAGSNSNRVLALTTGSIDSAIFSMPTAQEMLKKNFPLLGTPKEVGQRPHGGLMVRSEKIDKSRDQVRRMAGALVESMNYIATNRAKVADYVSGKFKIERDLAEQLLSGDYLSMLTMDGRMTDEGVQAYLDEAFQNTLVPTRFSAKQALDLSLLEPAAARR
ncbi:MAG: ABC transporter substrate-binding protein [Deltaproteobacteria bacterium]|nr:ABC transporter substrate-binding protein [Deltaproteobacteria bacterium]